MKGRTCGRCGRTVWCYQEGDAWVGQCNYCGQFHVEDADEIPAPKQKPELLGVLVEWEDDSDDERISHGRQFFEDPDEAEKYEASLPSYFKKWVWPVYNETD